MTVQTIIPFNEIGNAEKGQVEREEIMTSA